MADYIISKRVQEDLRKIWYYTIETWSENQADIYFRNLTQSMNLIAEAPCSVGRSYEIVQADYRGFRSGRHIIFYKDLRNGKVRIVRILHEQMDFGRHF